MLKISISEKEQIIEMNGPALDVLNDALNAVGILAKEFEKLSGFEMAAMFIAGIPKAIMAYRNDKDGDTKKEDQHEDDAL